MTWYRKVYAFTVWTHWPWRQIEIKWKARKIELCKRNIPIGIHFVMLLRHGGVCKVKFTISSYYIQYQFLSQISSRSIELSILMANNTFKRETPFAFSNQGWSFIFNHMWLMHQWGMVCAISFLVKWKPQSVQYIFHKYHPC